MNSIQTSSPNTFTLYHYWRSSSSWRVRAALAYKKIAYTPVAISLLNDEANQPDYLAMNPTGAVPTLKISSANSANKIQETVLIESLAIIRYLDQTHPTPPLLPGNEIDQAKIWALAELINSGIQPIQNLPVLHYFTQNTQADKKTEEQKKWVQHFIRAGLENYENYLTQLRALKNNRNANSQNFSYGPTLTLADLCLIPQCYNAVRYEVDLAEFPLIQAIHEHCLTLDCFQESHPDRFN